MGQTLEKRPHRDGELCEDSHQQPADLDAMEVAGQEESRDQDSSSSRSSWGGLDVALTRHPQDTQIGQPIRSLGQQDHARGEQRGGVRESWSFARTAGELKTFLSFRERRQNSNHSQNSKRKAVACAGTAAMEEQRNGRRAESGRGKSGADAQTGSPAASCERANEDGFIVPREDQSEGENTITFGNGTRATVAEHHAPQEKGRRKSDAVSLAADGAEADKSSAAACFEREMGRHLAEVTGGRCRLKAASNAGAAHPETTGEAEEPSRKERAEGTGETAAEESGGGRERGRQSSFAGAVSRRAKAGMAAKPEGSPGLRRPADPHPQMPPSAEILSAPLEEADPLPCPPLMGSEGVNEERQTAAFKRDSELVCFTAVVSPPPLTWDGSAADGDSGDTSVPRAKGPPPPVPKKPKNPFIKLKTAQLTEAQRRCKDLRPEERIKRRHTFHFNKDAPWITAKNQDMCSQWDEKGAYVAPTSRRPLSVDLSPWEHGCLDDQYGSMIDFDYCERIERLSPDEDLQNLDMLQRRVFLERRSRFRSTPPPLRPLTSREPERAPQAAPYNELSPAHQLEVRSEVSNHRRHSSGDGGGSDVDSYKPVAEIIKATNQMQKHQSRVKAEGVKPQLQLGEQSPIMKVSQMKNTFDAPKKTRERPAEIQSSPKKGKKRLRLSKAASCPESTGAF